MKKLYFLSVLALLSLAFIINCGEISNKSVSNKMDLVTNSITSNHFPVSIEKVVDKMPQVKKDWKIRKMAHPGIILYLPSDFTGESHSWQPTRFKKEYVVEKDDSGDSQIEISIYASPIDEKSFKSLLNLSRQQKLKFIFNLNKDNLSNKKPIIYGKNGIKGFLLKEELDNDKFKVEWVTYRYFKDFDPFSEEDTFEMRSFVLEIFGPKEDLSKMMRVIDSLKFLQTKENYLAL